MKIYYICEYCERIFQELEVEGEDGAVEVSGMCEECAMEMGLTGPTSVSRHYYN